MQTADRRAAEDHFAAARRAALALASAGAARRRGAALEISTSDTLDWLVGPQGMRVVPVRRDPVMAFRGQGRGGAARRLVAESQSDRSKE